jgi:ACS family hexuronate transporter-like MFS transporter
VLGLLKPVLEKELGWREADYGWIVFAFQFAYALMMPFAGRLIDKLGTRLGYLLAVVVWSFAAMAHALAANALQFGLARFALGFGESANFPAAIKTVADWFPQRERALATGIFNSGANIGAVVAPLVVPFLAVHYGWRSAFIFTGAVGFVWVILWLWLYHKPQDHPRLSPEELALIEAGDKAGEGAQRIPYSQLLTSRAAWAFCVGKFLTDPLWWFYMFWLPGFLNRSYGIDLSNLGLPVVLQASTIGSIGGGWISSTLLKRGWTLNAARKTAMLICALSVTRSCLSRAPAAIWLAVALVSVAAPRIKAGRKPVYVGFRHVPARRGGRPGSALGMGGAIGGMLVAPAVGYWLDWSHGAYGPLFVVAGSMYLIALALIQLLVPKLEKAR